MQQHNLQLNPLALLAGVLFNMDKVDKVKVKADDQAEEIEIDVKAVSVETEGDSLMCIIPIARVMEYNNNPYNFQMKVKDGLIVMTLDKASETLSLFSASGAPQAPKPSEDLKKLMDRMR